MIIDDEGIRKTILFNLLSIAPKSEKDACTTSSNASTQSEYSEGLPGKFFAIDVYIITADSQGCTALSSTQMTNEVEHDAICHHARYAEKGTRVDREYAMNHIASHEIKGSNTQYVLIQYGRTTANDYIGISHNILACPITYLPRQAQGTCVSRQSKHWAN